MNLIASILAAMDRKIANNQLNAYKSAFNQTVTAHLFDGVAIQDIDAEISIRKQAVIEDYKRFGDFDIWEAIAIVGMMAGVDYICHFRNPYATSPGYAGRVFTVSQRLKHTFGASRLEGIEVLV
jgi:hypothetical protein